VLDDLSTGKLSNLNNMDKVIVKKESITNRKAVSELMQKFRFKYVFHFAAKISVAESMSKPIEYNFVNTIGTIILLEEAQKSGVERFVFSSSAAIYGKDPRIPKVETHSSEIISPYAQTKLDGEYYLKQFNTNRMKTISLRYFNVFGERQDPKSQYAAAIPQFIDKACVQKVDLPIFGDGEQTRDFVYVKDVVLANVFAATEMDEKYTGTVYNVGYGKKITINDLAKLIIRYCGNDVKIKHVDPRPGDVKHSMASVDKLKSTGWEPKYEFNSALKQTVNYFLQKK
jgi:UDP-glucose 4-epimerase